LIFIMYASFLVSGIHRFPRVCKLDTERLCDGAMGDPAAVHIKPGEEVGVRSHRPLVGERHDEGQAPDTRAQGRYRKSQASSGCKKAKESGTNDTGEACDDDEGEAWACPRSAIQLGRRTSAPRGLASSGQAL
jgi:hypothetical protein